MIAETASDSLQVLDGKSIPPGVAPGSDPSGSSVQMRVAGYALGLALLIGSVVFVASPSYGLVALVAGVAVLMWIAIISGPMGWPVRRLWAHLAAAVIALISLLGLCASACGTYALYQDFLSVPTGLVAVLLHVGVVVMLTPIGAQVLRLVGGGSEEGVETARVCAIAAAIGASGFYASLLISGGVWCGACAAIHALMLVQALELVVASRSLRRYAAIVTAVAAAGVVNLVYHHRSVPTVRNDPAELLAYLRGAWASDSPPQQFVPSAGPDGAAAAAGSDAQPTPPATPAPGVASPALRAADLPADSTPLPPLASEPTAAPPATGREVRDANRWGSSAAPVVLALGIDTGCPVCAKEFGQVLELKDLVEHGRVQVRFLLTYRNPASQATASLAYAAGMVGEVPMLMTLDAFYAHQQQILQPADATQYLPSVFPLKTALTTLRSQQGSVTTLLADATHLKDQLGSIGDPTIWLIQKGQAQPARKFTGLTLAEILRVAIVSLQPPP